MKSQAQIAADLGLWRITCETHGRTWTEDGTCPLCHHPLQAVHKCRRCGTFCDEELRGGLCGQCQEDEGQAAWWRQHREGRR